MLDSIALLWYTYVPMCIVDPVHKYLWVSVLLTCSCIIFVFFLFFLVNGSKHERIWKQKSHFWWKFMSSVGCRLLKTRAQFRCDRMQCCTAAASHCRCTKAVNVVYCGMVIINEPRYSEVHRFYIRALNFQLAVFSLCARLTNDHFQLMQCNVSASHHSHCFRFTFIECGAIHSKMWRIWCDGPRMQTRARTLHLKPTLTRC